MIISEKQIMRLMDFVNDYCVILARAGKDHVDVYNSIRLFLDTITSQQSEELKEIQ